MYTYRYVIGLFQRAENIGIFPMTFASILCLLKAEL